MIERSERVANAKDRDAINRAIATVDKDRREEIMLSAIVCGLGVVGAGVFLYVTRPVQPVTAALVVAVLVVAIGFGGPTYRGWRSVVNWKGLRKSGRELRELRSLLSGTRLHVMHCKASDAVGIGDADDDIDEYVFQVGADRMLVLPSWAEDQPGFPSHEFEIVSRSEDFEDFLAIHALGAHLKPRHHIRREQIRYPDWPGDDIIVAGQLADLTRATGAT